MTRQFSTGKTAFLINSVGIKLFNKMCWNNWLHIWENMYSHLKFQTRINFREIKYLKVKNKPSVYKNKP